MDIGSRLRIPPVVPILGVRHLDQANPELVGTVIGVREVVGSMGVVHVWRTLKLDAPTQMGHPDVPPCEMVEVSVDRPRFQA